mmetsp:Transcript_138651/g.276503  ORF Transcript_138651/g.276503 Transcript_138651/m.276503 type:complete len:334 (-) Transcript_138651:166-1167(-)
MFGLHQPFLKVSREDSGRYVLPGDFSSPHDNSSRQENESKILVYSGSTPATFHDMVQLFKRPCDVLLVFLTGLLLGAVIANRVPHQYLPNGATPSASPYSTFEPPATVPAEYFAAKPLNNSCLIDNLQIPDGPQTFDACGFVIRSTDEVWNLRGDVTAAIDKYFHDDYVNAGSWGRRGIGKKALHDAVLAEMRAFPDIQIHITDCVCKGNDIAGYKCAMPDILDGTNMGPSAYGPATGKYARWTGLVQSLVKKNARTGQWQYVAEWGVHDEWSLIQQLGLDFKRVPRPWRNTEPLHDCQPLLSFHPRLNMDSVDEMDKQFHRQAFLRTKHTSV